MFNKEKNNVNYKRERLVRVVIKYNNGGLGSGTGFFINSKGMLLTCFHVVFGAVLKSIRDQKLLDTHVGGDEHEKLLSFINANLQSLEVELCNGEKKSVRLLNFNETHDTAVLQVEEKIQTKFFKLDSKHVPKYDQPVFFCGFQSAVGYSPDNFPFAVNRGVVSSFLETAVGGEKYPHIQLNSINLGGNSGAPLFCESKNRVIGIINGNMNMGADNVAFVNNVNNTSVIQSNSFRIPLSIAYVTSINIIKEQTDLLKNYNLN